MSSVGVSPGYTDTYIDSVFFKWYEEGRNNRISARLPSFEGEVPSSATIMKWRKKYDWDQRADALDAEVSLKLEKEAIELKAKAIKKLAKAGEELVDKGLEYLKEESFDTASAAVRAVIGGADMMSKFVGMGEFILGVSKMNDQQLTKEFYRLLGKNEDADAIDAEVQADEDGSDKSEDNLG